MILVFQDSLFSDNWFFVNYNDVEHTSAFDLEVGKEDILHQSIFVYNQLYPAVLIKEQKQLWKLIRTFIGTFRRRYVSTIEVRNPGIPCCWQESFHHIFDILSNFLTWNFGQLNIVIATILRELCRHVLHIRQGLTNAAWELVGDPKSNQIMKSQNQKTKFHRRIPNRKLAPHTSMIEKF